MWKGRLLALTVALLCGGCASWAAPQHGSNSCRTAPDPAQCVRDSQERVERAENREVRRQIEHRTKRDDQRVHYPDDGDWSQTR
ncbi:MAG TPA: hypothetical protein VG841_08120 [Caulobacterales bacterium]|nr:hypothetical protein [Caulobacterales bacterium]